MNARLVGLVSGFVAYVFGYQTWGAVNDTDAAIEPAWQWLHHGTVALTGAGYVPAETVKGLNGAMYSDRPLGMILASLPGQFGPHASRFGAAVTAAVLVGLASAALWHLMPGVAAAVVIVGAPTLYVAGRTLWPETIAAALIGAWWLVTWYGRRGSALMNATLFALVAVATLCRPPLGLLLAAVSVCFLADRNYTRREHLTRYLAPMAGLLAGVAILAAYAHATLGTFSPAGGYPVSHRIQWWALCTGLFSPARGLLFWSPWLAFVRPHGRGRWVVAIATCYVLGSWLLYDAWGGDGFVGYRYALPLAALAAPWVQTAGSGTVAEGVLARTAVCWSCGLGAVALVLARRPVDPARVWSHSGIPAPVLGYAALVSFVLLVGWGYRDWRELKARRARVSVVTA